ncbi:acetyl-CoA carboxylase biotin carboxyl carrier protein [Salibacterium salarium]|uniref:Biotin carboxyl carrier protein of acetyl-CoA carboxylase n=1 Tax=Salibacterium salarium TaxID=284579 RepID=A0A3R9WPT1_9BACI|nr:acetyl-CoA carboxylase biotin carboxyl carrier protein [Salibacterium salarium]RSL30984.1 acetyl-CoA carboxylase biotin carboxyl carrier protein [Salibacterium salarium]
MFEINEIKELIRAVDESSVGELEIRGETKEKLTIKKEGAGAVVSPVSEVTQVPQQAVAPAPPTPPAPSNEPAAEKQEDDKKDDSLEKIVSPMVGTFYRSPSPEAEVYVNEGDKVKEDTVVCIIEAMKLMNELEAEVSGEIVETLVDNGELVEYGQPLFLVKHT